ncbi:unnamed protein product [Prorocentrum cordatum]|uniref:Uncharacterized protein n=1 Tax=Prorocentrum cordatum TaxID=2364126 RepID=A0ABN9PDN0_9DINO|nr:unnamed protein product [Polarella glacialis]
MAQDGWHSSGGKARQQYHDPCPHCKYRWNFKNNHWCYQCAGALVSQPDGSKRPLGQWAFGPPQFSNSPFHVQPAGSPFADPTPSQAAAAAATGSGKGRGKKGAPPPSRGKAKAKAAASAGHVDRRPWVYHQGWYPYGGASAPLESADPMAALRAKLGDDGTEALAAVEALLAKKEAPPPAAPRQPLLEEDVSTKGVAYRRAKSWLERRSLKVLEGEAWLQEARDAEDLAVAAAVEAKRSWEEACAKQLPQPVAAPPAAAGASSLNLSTLLGEDSEVEGLTIVDGPIFSTEGLDLDLADLREWDRVKNNLAAGIKAEISKALGSSAEQLAALRAEAKQVSLRMQAKRRDFSKSTDPGLPSTFYGDIFMSAAEELVFDPQLYLANLYKVTLNEGCPTRICERAWRARRSQRARDLQMLRNLESEDHELWQEELQRQAMALMEALETLDTRAPQRRVQGGFQVAFPFCGRPHLAAPPDQGSQAPAHKYYGYWQFGFSFRASFGFGQFCEDCHLCFGHREWVSGGVNRMPFQHGVHFHGCFDGSALDSDDFGARGHLGTLEFMGDKRKYWRSLWTDAVDDVEDKVKTRMVASATEFKQGLDTMRLVVPPKTMLISSVISLDIKLAKKLRHKSIPVQYCLEAVDLGVDATGRVRSWIGRFASPLEFVTFGSAFRCRSCEVLCDKNDLLEEAIPNVVFLTGPWDPLNVVQRSAEVLPKGAEFRFYNYSQMDQSVLEISPLLEREGVYNRRLPEPAPTVFPHGPVALHGPLAERGTRPT